MRCVYESIWKLHVSCGAICREFTELNMQTHTSLAVKSRKCNCKFLCQENDQLLKYGKWSASFHIIK